MEPAERLRDVLVGGGPISSLTACVLFPVCFLGIAIGSDWLSRGLNRLGTRFALLPGVLGLLMALGADSPRDHLGDHRHDGGDQEVGVGVVLGSNLFNLAALMGLSAILAGQVSMRRGVLALNAGVSLLETGFVPSWCSTC